MRTNIPRRLIVVACCLLLGLVDGRTISLWGTDVDIEGHEPATERKKVLVIVYGEVRGGEVARESLIQRVLRHYDADLALLGPPPPPADKTAPTADNSRRLWAQARYRWAVPDVRDWGRVISRAGGCEDDGWLKLCKQKGPKARQFLGGGAWGGAS
jgi:hypothetical protein